jgi:hypothetical protein
MKLEYEPAESVSASFCDGEITLSALRDLYLAAGLSHENARKSAEADYEDYFGSLAPCAA